MQYKSLCLQMIQDHPQLYNRLLSGRNPLAELNRYAQELKDRHAYWMDQLSQARPGSNPTQIGSEAGEIALKEVEDSLPPELPQEEDEPLSLDAAMAFITRHTQPA